MTCWVTLAPIVARAKVAWLPWLRPAVRHEADAARNQFASGCMPMCTSIARIHGAPCVLTALKPRYEHHDTACPGRHSRPDEPVRTLPHGLGLPVHRCWHCPGPVAAWPVPGAWPHGDRPGQPAGGPADLGDDHPDAAEGRFRCAAAGQGALARHRCHPVHQLGGQAFHATCSPPTCRRSNSTATSPA